MNRSVLLVICDFLILTLLSFVQFERTAEPLTKSEVGRQVTAPALSNLLATMEAALELERLERESLTNALAMTSAELEERRRLLLEREERLAQVQDRLSQSESESERLARERAELEQTQREAQSGLRVLQEAFERTQQSTVSLADRLEDSAREAAEAQGRLRAMEEELGRRQAEAQAMQERMDRLDQAREELQSEKVQLVGELRQTETEARMTRQMVTNLNTQLTVATEQKSQLIASTARLATNVESLNVQSVELREQSAAIREESAAIREQIDRQVRLPANTIFGNYLTNRVRLTLQATSRGAFGQEVNRQRESSVVFVRQNNQVFVLAHVDATPLKIWPPETPWLGFGLELGRDAARWTPRELSLVRRDPRLILIPVDASVPVSMGVGVYDVATDPSQFAEAVVVASDESYYGETRFQLSAEHPGYVRMDRSTFRRMLGEFSPRKGDVALTRTGLFLGILVNGDHCLLPEALEVLPPIPAGVPLEVGSTTSLMRAAQEVLERMPSALR
jgi:hypothetical protein